LTNNETTKFTYRPQKIRLFPIYGKRDMAELNISNFRLRKQQKY